MLPVNLNAHGLFVFRREAEGTSGSERSILRWVTSKGMPMSPAACNTGQIARQSVVGNKEETETRNVATTDSGLRTLQGGW